MQSAAGRIGSARIPAARVDDYGRLLVADALTLTQALDQPRAAREVP